MFQFSLSQGFDDDRSESRNVNFKSYKSATKGNLTIPLNINWDVKCEMFDFLALSILQAVKSRGFQKTEGKPLRQTCPDL